MNLQPHPQQSRGLLRQTTSLAQFTLTRIIPDKALADMIENYWIIEWDRPGAPDYIQQNIPHPSANLVIDPQGQTGLFGIVTARFSYTITQSGALFGCKFWPGGLRAFGDVAMHQLTDQCCPIINYISTEDADLIARFDASNDKHAFAQYFDALLLVQQPVLTDKAKQARHLVATIDANNEIFSVADLAGYAGMTPRSLQRLFQDYVGVSPAWTIQRYRIIDAVDAINKGEEVDLTTLAQNLGFYDSAHFSNSFKALIGTSPNAYRASLT